MQKQRDNSIQALLKETGLTRKEFAKKYRIPLSSLSHWINGTSNPPIYVVHLLEFIHLIIK